MIPIYSTTLEKAEIENVNDCLKTGWISGAGKYVTEFEKEFAQFLNVPYALSVMNGTSALHLLLLSSGIGPGDEVIVPDFTFISTALAVSHTGAKPICVDVEKDSWNINPEKIEKAITNKTKAILAVHIYGLPAKMDTINKIAKKHKLLVLEDAAEALGAKIGDKYAGTISDGAIFSFYGNKVITCGEGGMLVTSSERVYKKAKALREYGRDLSKGRYLHTLKGFNFRMTNLQAAIGLGQLTRVESILQKKEHIFKEYYKYLQNISGISFQIDKSNFKNSYWLISILIEKKKFGVSKTEMVEMLNAKGIETRDFFYPIHSQPIYKYKGSFPVCENLFKNGLSLPSYPALEDTQIKYICGAIKTIHESAKNH